MITNESWMTLAKTLATDSDPYLHSPAAMDRAVKVFAPYIHRVPTPSGKFHAINNCKLIDFRNAEEQAYYDEAMKRYIEECARLKKNPAEGHWQMLVAFGKFRRAAEEVRAATIADLLNDVVVNQQKAGVACCCFRNTIARIVRALVLHHGYKRDDISLIWGGNDIFDVTKRLKQEEIQKYLIDMALGKDIPKKIIRLIEKQLVETEEESAEILESKDIDLRLGSQSRQDRQREIDRFQTGKSKICIFTFSAGGVGLSLHHTDKDDRGNPVSLLPRRTFLTPTYSAQDFVQGLGRAHRSIFSLSDTEQSILFYKGTIEVAVMNKVSVKLKCLSKVVRQRESWQDAILNPDVEDKMYVEDTQSEIDMATDESESDDED